MMMIAVSIIDLLLIVVIFLGLGFLIPLAIGRGLLIKVLRARLSRKPLFFILRRDKKIDVELPEYRGNLWEIVKKKFTGLFHVRADAVYDLNGIPAAFTYSLSGAALKPEHALLYTLARSQGKEGLTHDERDETGLSLEKWVKDFCEKQGCKPSEVAFKVEPGKLVLTRLGNPSVESSRKVDGLAIKWQDVEGFFKYTVSPAVTYGLAQDFVNYALEEEKKSMRDFLIMCVGLGILIICFFLGIIMLKNAGVIRI